MVNENHPVVKELFQDVADKTAASVAPFDGELKGLKADLESLEKLTKDKKEEEITSEEKAKKEELQKKISEVENNRKKVFEDYAASNIKVKQLIDLALLANNMLKGEDLAKFVKRSVEFVGK